MVTVVDKQEEGGGPSALDWGWLIVPKQSQIVLKTIENEKRTRREQNRRKVGYICRMATRGYYTPDPQIGCDKDYLKIS